MNIKKIQAGTNAFEIALVLLWLWGSPLAGIILAPWVASWSVAFLFSVAIVYAAGMQKHPMLTKDCDTTPITTPLSVTRDVAIAVALAVHGHALTLVLHVVTRVAAAAHRWNLKRSK